MRKIIFTFALLVLINKSISFASNPDNKLKLTAKNNSLNTSVPYKRVFVGGDIGATFGDYTQITISPLIGYNISNQVSTGIQFIYNHSWQEINTGQVNQTSLQSNTYGGNIFLQYAPVSSFYLKGEFEYDSYGNYETSQGTKVTQAVPFIFLGMGYSKAISKYASFNAGIKIDVLNNDNSPYEDFTPFLYVGVGVGI